MKRAVWVLDTNVLVSGLLNPSGFPGRLVDAILSGHLNPALDDRIYAEYSEVFARPKFGFNPADVRDFLAYLRRQHWITARPLSVPGLPDATGLPFAEVARSLEDPVLVTGNPRHFPISKMHGVVVLSPQQAWKRLLSYNE